MELVGSGESCAAWRVRAGGQEVLFRFSRRPPQEMPATVADEFAALRHPAWSSRPPRAWTGGRLVGLELVGVDLLTVDELRAALAA